MNPGLRTVILIGASGSGKNTLIRADYRDASVVSTDDFFTDWNKEYRFDMRYIDKAHNWCRREFIHAAFIREPLLVVNNTNTSMYEIGGYLSNAEAFGYDIEFVHLLCASETAFKRNVHGTPENNVIGQTQRILKFIPELLAARESMRKPWTFRTVDTN